MDVSDLLEYIASGPLVPGDRLVETRVAKDMGVSRVPVREAMNRLVAQGVLVCGGSRQGVFLRRYTEEEVQHLYELREAIEGMASGLAAKRSTSLDRQRVAAAYRQMDAMMDREGVFGTAPWAAADLHFHRTIIDAGKNERFISIMNTLLSECRLVFYRNPFRLRALQEKDALFLSHIAEVRAEHRSLYEAVMEGDAENAEKVARDQLRNAARMAIHTLVRADASHALSESEKVWRPAPRRTKSKEIRK